MAIIYHVTTAEEWQEAQGKGNYVAPSLVTEGFIHCSEAGQVAGVLERYFAGKQNLVKLVIDTGRLKHRLQYDIAPSMGEAFPHIYGPINLEAVIKLEPVEDKSLGH
jgi:uncharacterized protein (DUF952 family)